jgi:hypothetical protein
MPSSDHSADAGSESCKGQLRYSYTQRMKNATLAKLDIPQLRVQTKYYGLDTSGLRFKVSDS